MIRDKSKETGNPILAISPPSDIVLDVARAVEPTGIETARAELLKRVRNAGPAMTGVFSINDAQPVAADTAAPRAGSPPDSLQKFEAMVLRTFVENMLPKQADAVYGGGMAGDMWKSMMAEKLADEMAARGGIGIADRLLRDHYMVDEKKVPVGPVTNLDARADNDRQVMLSTAMVQELQRKLTRSITDDEPATSISSGI